MIVVIGLLLFASGAAAQDPSSRVNVSFDVASIRPNTSGSGRMASDLTPGGRLTLTNVSVRDLVRDAYGLRDVQIVGGPPDVLRQRFDIVATAPAGVSAEQVRQMMRALLAERFTFVAHNDQRELPVYELVRVRPEGAVGPRLRPRSDCAGREPAREPPAGGKPPCGGVLVSPGRVAARGMLLSALGFGVDRIVVDKTGLTGHFDVDLEFTPEQVPRPGADQPADLPQAPANGPSVLTALRSSWA